MIRLLKIIIVFFSILNICRAQAQSEAVDLEPIVVTGTHFKTAKSSTLRKVETIGTDVPGFSLATDASSVLKADTSSNIASYGGPGASQEIRMRGFTASQVLVMVDGRPLNSPRDGAADLNTLPLDNIERLEVMPGAASSLYGSSAMGGVINVITRNPPESGHDTAFLSSVGTFRSLREKFSDSARINNFGYVLSGGWNKTEGFRENSEHNAKDLNAKLVYDFDRNNKASFNSGFYYSRTGVPGPVSAPDSDDIQRNLKKYADFIYDSASDNAALSARIYGNYDRLGFWENTAGSFWDSPYTQSVHTTCSIGGNLQGSRKITDYYSLVAGANYTKNANNSSATGKHRYNARALYLENSLDFFDDLHFVLTARADDYSNFGSTVNPAFSVLYRFAGSAVIRAGTGRSFRAPTFNDLYWPDEGWAKGNPALRPETGVNSDIGLENEFNKYLKAGVTYYYSRLKSLIQWAPDTSGLVWQPQNIGAARISGTELRAQAGEFWGKLSFDFGLSFSRSRDQKTRKYLVYQPQHKYNAAVKIKDLKGFSACLSRQYYGKRFHDADNTIEVKHCAVINFDLEKRFSKNFTCLFSVNNIADKKYRVINDYPMPGLAVNAGVKIEF